MDTRAQFDPLWFCGPIDDAEQRHTWIAEAAYFLAQRRQFEPGHELEDWLAAEAIVDGLLSLAQTSPAGMHSPESQDNVTSGQNPAR